MPQRIFAPSAACNIGFDLVIKMVTPGRPSSSGELFLHFEVVLDKGLDDLVDAGVGGEAEGGRARGGERLRPAGDDAVGSAGRAPSGSARRPPRRRRGEPPPPYRRRRPKTPGAAMTGSCRTRRQADRGRAATRRRRGAARPMPSPCRPTRDKPPSRPDKGSRMIEEAKVEAARLGRPGRTTTVGRRTARPSTNPLRL